jgi:hypothetical protein
MEYITVIQHKELTEILDELVKIIADMRMHNNDVTLYNNYIEAKEWLDFLIAHNSKESIKSLETEISNRLFLCFDVQIENTKMDTRRTELMKTFIRKATEYLQ